MRSTLSAVLLLSALTASAAAPTIEPPPGWKDVIGEGKVRNAVIALKGPETSSFVVKRAPSAPLDNPAGVRGYLHDVLGGLRDASRKDYRTSGRVETRVFRNGVTAQILRAQLAGEDRVILALFGAGGVPHLAVLMSAAPDAMVASLIGGIQIGRIEGAILSAGAARSLDGQLELALGGGLRSRALLDSERAKGFVLVVQGAGSEVLFLKLAEADATKPAEQAAIVRELTATSASVPAGQTAPVREAPTAAGPIGVYSWAQAAAGDRIAVGYLPWGYWGYQVFGRGPSADELMVGALAALKAGPVSVPGLLASTPRIPIKKESGGGRLALGAAALVVAALAAWSLRRKNGRLGS